MTLNLNNLHKCNGLRYAKVKFERHDNNNCYTYAINQNVSPYTKKPFMRYDYCQPGMLGGKIKSCRKNIMGRDYSNYPQYIKADLQDIGYELIPSTYEEYIEDNRAWKIAFCYCCSDYHFYRQNKNGTWSHKKGASIVSRVDESGKPIYNPQTCNRGKYDTFVGFFIIRPIQH